MKRLWLFLKSDYSGYFMFAKKKFLKLLAEKNEIFGSIPENLIAPDKIEEIRRIPVVALGDIRNGKQLLAVLKVLKVKKPDAFLPVLTYTGTEYGDVVSYGKYLNLILSFSLLYLIK